VSDSKRASGGGITFLGALTILFIGLKLTDNIDWSWGFGFFPPRGSRSLCCSRSWGSFFWWLGSRPWEALGRRGPSRRGSVSDDGGVLRLRVP
jgi:hypothetical protein